MTDAVWEGWGWRMPFILSLLLLVISLWMRLKLSESPVFRAMKAAGELARNPLKESFTYPGNRRRIFIALFGIAEIGRASCRERVCQYVYIPVVAVPFKKKKKITKR